MTEAKTNKGERPTNQPATEPKELSTDRELWERQKGESGKAFEAFKLYRDMGLSRSLTKVASELGKSGTLISRWAGLWSWRKRTDAWDDECDRAARESRLKEIEAMNRRHIRFALEMQAKARKKLRKMKVEEDMSARDVARFMKEAAVLERLARGEATEKVSATVEGQVKHDHEHRHSGTFIQDIAEAAINNPAARDAFRQAFRDGIKQRTADGADEGSLEGRRPEEL